MFEGFTSKTPEFLWELAFNNERTWFAEHKGEFEQYVNEPMKALMAAIVDAMNERWPDVGFEGHVSRIYRDARRLFGRGPFKDHLWISIHSADVGRHGPGFWFEVSPRGYSFGMGWYEISAAGMERFREGIAANPARFERIAKGIERHKEFTVYGEEYKRPKGDFGETVNRWYNRRHIGCGCDRDFEGDVLTPELPQIITDEFAKLMPLYDYLRELYHAVGDFAGEEQL